jgi:hypothetical protein
LRREVKLAACLIACLLPMTYHASHVFSNHLGQIAASDLTRPRVDEESETRSELGVDLARKVSRSLFQPAVVLMSIEPAPPGQKSEVELPVNFPGILLPADSLEETTHEGS